MAEPTLTRWGSTQQFKLKVGLDDDRLDEVLEFVQPEPHLLEDVVLSPETSQELLSRLLARAGATIVTGVVVVEWADDRDDIVIFANGAVRELREEEQSERARRIVDAAHGRDREARVSAADRLGSGLPDGESDHPCPGPWEVYTVDGGFMAWDNRGQRFDASHLYPSAERCERRVWSLNWCVESNGATGRVANPVPDEFKV